MTKIRELRADELPERVAAVARQRPDLDIGMFPLYFNLKRIAHALDEPRERFAEQHRLKVSDVGMLLVLRRGGPGYSMRPTDLHHQMLVTSGTVTKQIDKLVARNLVKRIPGDGDGRSVRVQLTARGEKIADDMWNCGSDMLSDFGKLAGIVAKDRERMAAMLSEWANAAEQASTNSLESMPGAKRAPKQKQKKIAKASDAGAQFQREAWEKIHAMSMAPNKR